MFKRMYGWNDPKTVENYRACTTGYSRSGDNAWNFQMDGRRWQLSQCSAIFQYIHRLEKGSMESNS